MKLILLSAGLVIVLASCTDKETVTQLENTRDSLRVELDKQGNELTEYFHLFSDIESNINEIKQREQWISLQQEEELTSDKSSREQLVTDMKAINNLLSENKVKIDELNKKLKGSNYQTAKFKKMVTELEEKISNQESDINTLNLKINDLLAQNADLNIRIDSLNVINTKSSEIITHNTVMIQELDSQIHKAYYAAGTSDELLERNIIEKEGGFIGLGKVERLNSQININTLNSVDIRDVSSFPLNSKNVELVTEHPQDSYRIVINEEENKVDRLEILDPERFWESTKVLVMLTK